MTYTFFAMDQVDAATVLGEHLINAILENASVETVKDILKSGAPVWYQNEEEGVSPLHAAAYVQNEELVAILIERGAVWNAVDNFKNTAGDIALSFNNAGIYTRIRDAGIRAGRNASWDLERPLRFRRIDGR